MERVKLSGSSIDLYINHVLRLYWSTEARLEIHMAMTKKFNGDFLCEDDA